MSEKKRIGILTSGGDAPGMNAVIRAVVRAGVHYGITVYGIRRGYEGLLHGEFKEMEAPSVSDIIQKGGTILRTARCTEMMKPEGQRKAAEVCHVLNLNALITVGGDGTFKGARDLSRLGVNVIAIPATIDLDMGCTDYTIGFDTAVNTGLEAINRIRDTSSSHERCSVVEVMGRDAGYLAVWCGLSGGAEEVIIPEHEHINNEVIIQEIMSNRARGKRHNLVVVAEGVGGSEKLAKDIEHVLGIESRATILGHLQRGGMPTARDRVHGSQMGCKAVEAVLNKETNKAVVYREGRYQLMDLETALETKKELSMDLYDMVKILAI